MEQKLKAKPTIFQFKVMMSHALAILTRDLKPSLSFGVDWLSARFLKDAGPSIFPVIANIYNLSILSSTSPSQWRIGRITPLFKEDDPTDPSNYRLVSVFPCMGKLLEHVVHS